MVVVVVLAAAAGAGVVVVVVVVGFWWLFVGRWLLQRPTGAAGCGTCSYTTNAKDLLGTSVGHPPGYPASGWLQIKAVRQSDW